jgi:hypothetical protein
MNDCKCKNFVLNPYVCHDFGEPKGQCLNCGWDEEDHSCQVEILHRKLVRKSELQPNYNNAGINNFYEEMKELAGKLETRVNELEDAILSLNPLIPSTDYPVINLVQRLGVKE